MGNLETFHTEFLGANTWPQRKDGPPLELLNTLSPAELKEAETALLKACDLKDTWPIIGLGHIKSTSALPKLYELLNCSKRSFRVTIAHAIFRICQDPEMINVVLEEVPRTTNEFELIDIVYMLPEFMDPRTTSMLDEMRQHKKYLVAYNATMALGLPTEEVIERFRK